MPHAPRSTPDAPTLDAHVVSHTHWDREWYLPAGRFRQRLVALVDELIDDPPSDGASFLLDGQAIVLEDYLTVRPERAAELASLLRAGRLEAGPWYVLADELIPSGESLVRNLLAGRRTLSSLRVGSPPVLYCPDSFGHPATLPELAAGFGLGLVILWRGYGGRRWPAGDVVRWRAPSGATAVVWHLPPDGYEYGSHLPVDDAGASERWHRMRTELGARTTLGVVLVPHGADHHARQAGWPEALAALTRAAAPDRARPSSLAAFADCLLARAARAELPEIAGELRDSYGYTWALQGTFASRAHQKRRNALVERTLVREAEPWAALARVAGARSRRPLVDAAWRALLQCHPHDTLCGCSTDEVARAMEARLDDALAQASGVRDDALYDLVGHDPVQARVRHADWRSVALVRNATARPRSGVALLELTAKVRDVPVGPGSARAGRAQPVTAAMLRLEGIHTQQLAFGTANERVESPRHYPDSDEVMRAEVIAWVPDVPAFGVRALPFAGGAVEPGPPAAVRGEGSRIESAAMRVEADERGIVTLELLAASPSGGSAPRRLSPLVAVEDRQDAGDLYTPSVRAVAAVPRTAYVSLRHGGPLRASLALAWELDAVGLREGEAAARVEVELALDAGAPFVRIRVRGDNRSSDHRLRLVIATGVPDAEVWADAAFGPVRRAPLVLPPEDMAAETPPRTAPLHRYVSLFGAGGGATVYSDGLAEYEAMPDGRVAVTLLRAVGELSRNDLPERPGHAGWPVPTPEAQCRGPFEAELALLLHGGTRDAETIALIERTADDVLLPLRGTTLRSAIATHDARGVELAGDGLACTTVKDAADGDWLVLRCVNLLDDPVHGAWRLPFRPREARLARLDETPLESPDTRADEIDFEAAPRAVVTILVR